MVLNWSFTYIHTHTEASSFEKLIIFDNLIIPNPIIIFSKQRPQILTENKKWFDDFFWNTHTHREREKSEYTLHSHLNLGTKPYETMSFY